MNLDDLLLTDEERDAVWVWIHSSIEEEEDSLSMICKAQRDKAVRGVVEWLTEICHTHVHHSGRMTVRMHCADCMEDVEFVKAMEG